MIDEEPRGSHYAITKIIYLSLIAMYVWLTTIFFFSHANYQNSGKIIIHNYYIFNEQEKNLKLTRLLCTMQKKNKLKEKFTKILK